MNTLIEEVAECVGRLPDHVVLAIDDARKSGTFKLSDGTHCLVGTGVRAEIARRVGLPIEAVFPGRGDDESRYDYSLRMQPVTTAARDFLMEEDLSSWAKMAVRLFGGHVTAWTHVFLGMMHDDVGVVAHQALDRRIAAIHAACDERNLAAADALLASVSIDADVPSSRTAEYIRC